MEKEQEEQEESVESLMCPSFSTYSSNNLHDIADQVTREDDHSRPQNDNTNNDENDFEFVAFRKAADEVFFDGHASHVFPIFNRDLLTERRGGGGGGGRSSGEEDDDAAAIRIPLGKLLIGEEERVPDPPSSSSSEVEDELEAIPAGTYCVWTPKSVQASPSRCKKSNSTGSSSASPSSSASKRWKLLSLLRRSKSDGKESLVVLTPSPKKGAAKGENSKEQRGGGRAEGSAPRVAGKKIPAPEKKNPVSAHEGLYGRKREIRRRSYLPYREDLFGFGVSLNPIGKGFPLHF